MTIEHAVRELRRYAVVARIKREALEAAGCAPLLRKPSPLERRLAESLERYKPR
jgi:hypothetical protein